MTLPSLKSSCLEKMVTQGELSSLVPSPLPDLPDPLDKELELITVTGLGPVKIARIHWTWPQAPSPNSQEFREFLKFVHEVGGDSDFFATSSWRAGGNSTPSGLAEVWRPQPDTWRFLCNTWRLGRCHDACSWNNNLSADIENSSIVHFNPASNYTCALRFFKKHVVTEEIYLDESNPSWSTTEVAFYDKIDTIELPEEEDTEDWTEEAWNERFKKVNEEEKVLMDNEMTVEDGWAALPFAPELLPLACGLFLASSVEYSWPGYIPGPGGDLWEENLLEVPKVVKVVKVGKAWKLLDFWMDSEALLLAGEGDSVVRNLVESGLASMRILPSGQLLLIRKILVSGLPYGGPDFKGASYSLYSPI